MMSGVTRAWDTESSAPSVHPRISGLTVGVGLLACAAFASAAFVGTGALAGVLLACGLLLAWGWPVLLDLPRPPGSSVVLLVGAAGIGLVTFLAPRGGDLRWLVTALAVSLMATFLHELVRTDGRRALTRSITGAVFGLAVLAVGAFHINALVAFDGKVASYAAAAGVAISLVVDLVIGRTRLGEWSLPLGMLLAAGAGTAIGLAADVIWSVPMLTALVSCGLSHALRRVTSVLPRAEQTPAQVATAVASLLFVGVVPYTTLWLLAR